VSSRAPDDTAGILFMKQSVGEKICFDNLAGH